MAGLPGRPGIPGRPGWGGPGYGGAYRPGYGWGVAAGLGAGLAYSNWCDPYYNNYYNQEPEVQSDAVAYCAQRFRTNDVATQTYIGKGGKRKRCP
ncbi:BA14K family protein [Bradyrhizobium diazoefficiens]|nr:BA14K family protein [Bradyrhizobium diazoefficiens]